MTTRPTPRPVVAVTAIAATIARRLNLGSTLGLLVVGAALRPASGEPRVS